MSGLKKKMRRRALTTIARKLKADATALGTSQRTLRGWVRAVEIDTQRALAESAMARHTAPGADHGL